MSSHDDFWSLVKMNVMPRIESVLLMLTIVSAASAACSVEDDAGDDLDSRASLVEQARTAASLALENYFDCMSEPDPQCADEQHELVEKLEQLDDLEAHAVVFRAKATADCGGGVTVSCEGTSCNALDGGGCACYGDVTYQGMVFHNQLQSSAICPDAADGTTPPGQ